MKPMLAAVAVVVALAFSGCGNGKTEATTPEPDDPRVVADDGPTVSAKGKQWGGWRWQGKRDDCFFVYRNRCYSDKKKACHAARCGASDCRTKGGGPATISCRE